MALHCYLLSSLFSSGSPKHYSGEYTKKDYSLSVSHSVILYHQIIFLHALTFVVPESYRLSNFTYVVLLNLME